MEFTDIQGISIYDFAYLNLDSLLNNTRFFPVERPAFIGRKKTLTKEQSTELHKAQHEAAVKHRVRKQELLDHARHFFGAFARRNSPTGWSGHVTLLVPIAHFGAWMDDAFKDMPEQRQLLPVHLDNLTQGIATAKQEHIRTELAKLDTKRKALEAELEDVRPIEQVKRVRRE